MPRPKQFDETEVLDKALELFWQKGFNGTSISDLVSGLGINRASLYDTFGGKQQLFMSALCRYQKITSGLLNETLGQEIPALAIIEQILDSAVMPENLEERSKGCFMLNCTTELGAENPDVAKLVNQNVKRNEGLFTQLIQRGQEQGNISTTYDARTWARYIFTVYNGLKVIAQTQVDTEMLEDVKRVALDTMKAS